MSGKKIVFILGAGASVPYGFPTGEKLVNEIIKQLPIILPKMRGRIGTPEMFEADAERFVTALKSSSQYSIDAFLEHHPEFWEIGKIAIAGVLLPCEKEGDLFTIMVEDNEDNWYKHIIQLLIGKPDDKFPRIDVSFITYNYDRSFEHCLKMALQHNNRNDENSAVEQIKEIPIIHVHGQLALLSWQEGEGLNIPYAYDLNSQYRSIVNQASKRINVIFEKDVDESHNLELARKELEGAEMIVFLGFGFDEYNLSRLKLGDYVTEETILYGTAFPSEKRHIAKLTRMLSRQVEGKTTNIFLHSYKCLKLIMSSDHLEI